MQAAMATIARPDTGQLGTKSMMSMMILRPVASLIRDLTLTPILLEDLSSPHPFATSPDKQQALELESQYGGGVATSATYNWAESTSTELRRADGSLVVTGGKKARKAARQGILEQLPQQAAVLFGRERGQLARHTHRARGRGQARAP